MSDAKQSKVSTDKIFSFNNGALLPIAGIGSFQTNVNIATGAAPRNRVGTTEILSDGPSAGVAGLEAGAGSATVNIPKMVSATSRVAPGAALVGGLNDTVNVGQHVVQGNGAEAAAETFGVGGQASGAWIGGELGGTVGSIFPGPGTVIGAGFGAGLGAFGGAKYAKDLGTYLTGGDTPDKIGPPLTLPNDTPLQPTVTTPDGHPYALVEIDGKYSWFAMLDNSGLMLANQYVEVVSGSKVAELTSDYLQHTDFAQQLQDLKNRIDIAATNAALDLSEISPFGSNSRIAPDGQAFGTTVQTEPNASQTWNQTGQPGLVTRTTDVRNPDGSATRVVADVNAATGKVMSERVYQNAHSANNPNASDSFNLVGVYDASTGRRQSINRETGAMEPVQGSAATSNYFNPAAALQNAPTGANTPGYMVQPGDTVEGISAKLGLTPAQYGDYLKAVYGPDADLNSIVTGRELPVPEFAPHAGSKPITSHASFTVAPSADNDYQPGNSNGEAEAAAYVANQNIADAAFEQLKEAFSNAAQSAENLKALDSGVQYADAGSGRFVSDAGGGSSMASSSSTLPISLRGGLVPVLRYGNYAGPSYAGGLGVESTITHPDVNKGQPILASVLTQTPQGLAGFMKLALKTEPNGYLDAVTRNHDVEYTVAEMRFMVGVQTQFGKLPYELTAQDWQDPAFRQLETARDGEYWKADQRMLTSMAQYKPTDFVDSTYRDAALTAFYVKAESGAFGYGLGEEVNAFYGKLKTIDLTIGTPTLGQSLSAFGEANALARSDFETLATLPLTPQERQFFNSHLQAGQWLNSSLQNADGSPVSYDNKDSTNRIVVPELLPGGSYGVRTQINGDTVTMILDRTDKDNPVFTKEVAHNGKLVSTETIRPDANDSVNQGQSTVRAYTSVVTDGSGKVLETHTIAKPGVPTLEIPPDLQQKIDAVKSGSVEQILSIPAAPANTTHTEADAAYAQLLEAFNNPAQYSKDKDVLLADAGNSGVVSDVGGGGGNSTAPYANPGRPQDLQTYLAGSGASLTPVQQNTLGIALGQLGLGDVDGNTLSLHTLPAGGALLANADGDIVGELSVSPTGVMRLQANTINADGTSTRVDVHVTGDGQVMTTEQYQQAQFNASANDAAGTLNLVNSLANLAYFDKLPDLGKLQSLVSLYNQIDGLGHAGASLTDGTNTGGNLPGDLSQWGAGLALITALQSNNPIAQASAAASLYNTFANSAGSTLAPIPIPYIQALNLIGAIESGDTVSMIASAVAFIPGWGTALSLAITILAPLLADKPPPPEGVTHFEWDAQGNIQIRVDVNRSHGGEIAQSTAQSVQDLLQTIVQSLNERTADTSDDLAINPYLLPRVGYSQADGAWIEIRTPDGGSYIEVIRGDQLAQRLFELLIDNGGIAPAWQVQTQLGHLQQLLDQGAGQGDIAAQLGAGAGGHAYHGNQAYALQGNAAESADFKTQSFGALVVHLNTEAVQARGQALQALQDQQAAQRVATSTLYRDTEGDGYYEQTQWVSATDADGNIQGLLVLDYNGDGQIETRDILNLGGNAGQAGNLAQDATLASANAHLQRNNVQWLDANGDGVLDARDPAFAAVRMWVDLNQDAQLDAGEQADLASLQITSIDFTTGEVTYADGHRDALSATTLQSDTEGLRYTQMLQADAQGRLHALDVDAGQMLEYEGYQGQVQVVDQGGTTRWGSMREATFEHDALRTGDWEGSAGQDQHRHGGTNVQAAPTQTRATGAVSLGAVQRVVFVPAAALRAQTLPDDGLETSMGGMAGMGALALVGLGAVQSTAFAAPGADGAPNLAADGAGQPLHGRNTGPEWLQVAPPATDGAHTAGAVQEDPVPALWQAAPRHLVDAPPPPGALADTDALQRAGLDLSAYTAAHATHTPLRQIRATLVSSSAPTPPSSDSTTAVSMTPASAEMLLDLPHVAGEVRAGTEDTVLRIDTNLLLANDSTANAGAQGGSAALHISAVDQASHGQVSLQTRLDGAGQTVTDVVFLPDPDFYGTASFRYTVTDAYGLSSTATATLQIGNVNDAPWAQGEVVSGASEDASFLIDKTLLLANDGDVDDAHSALGIGWVGNAAHGSVSLDANGDVVFVPGLNFNGNAEFEYRVVDAAGLLSPAVSVVMPVAAVNDAPLAVDDQFQTYVNSTMTIGFAQLLGNDSDVENDTLHLADVGNATHGVVRMVGGAVEFVPTPGYTGAASFDYLADDGNGGQTWATALVEVKPPPNLYASVNLLGTSFYGTQGNAGWAIDIASASFAMSDDGDTAFASISLQSVSVLRTDYSRPESSQGDTYYPYYAWQDLAGVNYFSYDNTGMSLDVRRGAAFTDFHSTWQVTDNRGLSNIWHFDYSLSGGATSYMEYSGYVGPVVLSLDGSDPSYIRTHYSQVRFDMDGDGVVDRLAWAAPGSGVLGIDLNGDHRISSADEFAFTQYVQGAQTDLEGLRAFDTNGNGLLDAGDRQWSRFGVWEDKNADGQTQDGEYQSLDALGIASIHLRSNAQVHSGVTTGGGADAGTGAEVTVMGDTTFTRTDGSTGQAADAMLAYQSGVHAQAADAADADADLARMALLFNQMANTALAPLAEPLGFVPVQPIDAQPAHEEIWALQVA